MKPLFASVVLLVAVSIAASPVIAKSVFVNGVDISFVKNQTFKNVTIHIDDKGDIYIDAPAYKVEVLDEQKTDAAQPTPASKPTPTSTAMAPATTQQFYLVTQPSTGGRAQYDFIIKINGIERQVIKSGSSQVITEITKWMRKGNNTVEIIAKKDLSAGRKSVSTVDVAEAIIGHGHEENGIVKIDKVNGSLKVNAAQLTNESKTFTVVAK